MKANAHGIPISIALVLITHRLFPPQSSPVVSQRYAVRDTCDTLRRVEGGMTSRRASRRSARDSSREGDRSSTDCVEEISESTTSQWSLNRRDAGEEPTGISVVVFVFGGKGRTRLRGSEGFILDFFELHHLGQLAAGQTYGSRRYHNFFLSGYTCVNDADLRPSFTLAKLSCVPSHRFRPSFLAQ